jgi:hypothetical protein
MEEDMDEEWTEVGTDIAQNIYHLLFLKEVQHSDAQAVKMRC